MIDACRYSTMTPITFHMSGQDAPQYVQAFLKNHDGYLSRITMNGSDYSWIVDACFKTPLATALFIMAISSHDDPERAAMFKMFWSGE